MPLCAVAIPPIVFLHGLGRSSVSLAHVATRDPLRGRRAPLVDLLGFGISDKPDDSLGGAVAVLVASLRPDLAAGVVVAEGNLDPRGAGLSLAIASRPEEDCVRHGFRETLEEMRAEALENPSSIFAATIGLQQLASPRAMHRTARALVELTRPTIRELLLGLDVPRAFIVGARTLEAGDRPPSGEAGDGLEGTGVGLLVGPHFQSRSSVASWPLVGPFPASNHPPVWATIKQQRP